METVVSPLVADGVSPLAELGAKENSCSKRLAIFVVIDLLPPFVFVFLRLLFGSVVSTKRRGADVVGRDDRSGPSRARRCRRGCCFVTSKFLALPNGWCCCWNAAATCFLDILLPSPPKNRNTQHDSSQKSNVVSHGCCRREQMTTTRAEALWFLPSRPRRRPLLVIESSIALNVAAPCCCLISPERRRRNAFTPTSICMYY